MTQCVPFRRYYLEYNNNDLPIKPFDLCLTGKLENKIDITSSMFVRLHLCEYKVNSSTVSKIKKVDKVMSLLRYGHSFTSESCCV